jgi:hypothetical protein
MDLQSSAILPCPDHLAGPMLPFGFWLYDSRESSSRDRVGLQ